MRIVAWNCCRGPLQKKLAALAAIAPDIAVIAESPAPVEESPQTLWLPSGVSKFGIQVRAWGEYTLQRLPAADLPNCVVPVRVMGPVPFTLLAVWTWPAPSYIKAFMNAVSAYSSLLSAGPVVVAGDFNGNPVFDKPGTRLKWAAAFDSLHQADLVSAYHQANAIEFGKEAHATHHFQRKAARPFHIDFCFVPRRWTDSGLNARVISDADWPSISDHFPLLVDVPASASPVST